MNYELKYMLRITSFLLYELRDTSYEKRAKIYNLRQHCD
jgi:hypothetical protein